jgi:hypothetical protein
MCSDKPKQTQRREEKVFNSMRSHDHDVYSDLCDSCSQFYFIIMIGTGAAKTSFHEPINWVRTKSGSIINLSPGKSCLITRTGFQRSSPDRKTACGPARILGQGEEREDLLSGWS